MKRLLIIAIFFISSPIKVGSMDIKIRKKEELDLTYSIKEDYLVSHTYSMNKIKFFEGFKSKPYYCPSGKLTIGYGFTNINRTVLTKKESDSILGLRYGKILRKLNKEVPKEVKLTEYQKAATVSLIYNIGFNAFSNSTLFKLIKKGDLVKAGEQIPLWNKATVNGVKMELRGLTKRRKFEFNLWNRNFKS